MSCPCHACVTLIGVAMIALGAGCGRIGYEPLGSAPDAAADSGASADAGPSQDGEAVDARNCDVDGDGSLATACGGDDCDDTEPSIAPGAEGPLGDPSCENGRDDDCDELVDGDDSSCSLTEFSPLGVAVRPYLEPIRRTFGAAGRRIYFSGIATGSGREPWVTDGTPGGTMALADINPTGDSDPWGFTAVGDRLFFFATDGAGDTEPWVTDGTPAGTRSLGDINPTASSVRFHIPAAAGSLFLFQADDGASGREPWVSDGTPAGTRLLSDLVPGSGGSAPYEMQTLDGTTAVFRANVPPEGVELWRTDGSATGTQLITDANPGGGASLPDGWFRYFATAGGYVYYRGTDGTHGLELWRTDGTSAGTHMVADILSTGDGVYGAPWPVAAGAGSTVYFTATGPDGVEPWVSDGTEAGTRQLRDVNASGDSRPTDSAYQFTPHGENVFFVADDGTTGYEPWVSDGTVAGTQLLRDIRPSGTSDPYGLFVFKDVFYFGADDGVRGAELWSSDGTSAGTVLAFEFNPSGSGVPYPIGVTPEYAILAADGGAADRYLWVAR